MSKDGLKRRHGTIDKLYGSLVLATVHRKFRALIRQLSHMPALYFEDLEGLINCKLDNVFHRIIIGRITDLLLNRDEVLIRRQFVRRLSKVLQRVPDAFGFSGDNGWRLRRFRQLPHYGAE